MTENTENEAAFVYKEGKRLRCGYTTGTCAALAAKASVRCLLEGTCSEQETVMTPKGRQISALVEQWSLEKDASGVVRWAKCAVRKDGGDDCDATNGLLIFVCAERLDGPCSRPIEITGGQGIGRVTKPGLDQEVGSPAINSVPRRMMEEAIFEVLGEAKRKLAVRLTVSAPGGERIAARTFNPTLGITGGISILGTSGIVEPMSVEALTETIRAHCRVLRAEHRRLLAAVPGNLGENYLKNYMKTVFPERSEEENEDFFSSLVTCSNFIGQTIDMAGELGFSELLIAGHIGKLGKLGNGIMNTHSREGDGRMDTLLSCALSAGGDRPLLAKIQGANTTDEAVSFLEESGLLGMTMEVLTDRIKGHVNRRAAETLHVEVILFGSGGRFLGMTKGAGKLLERMVQWRQ